MSQDRFLQTLDDQIPVVLSKLIRKLSFFEPFVDSPPNRHRLPFSLLCHANFPLILRSIFHPLIPRISFQALSRYYLLCLLEVCSVAESSRSPTYDGFYPEQPRAGNIRGFITHQPPNI